MENIEGDAGKVIRFPTARSGRRRLERASQDTKQDETALLDALGTGSARWNVLVVAAALGAVLRVNTPNFATFSLDEAGVFEDEKGFKRFPLLHLDDLHKPLANLRLETKLSKIAVSNIFSINPRADGIEIHFKSPGADGIMFIQRNGGYSMAESPKFPKSPQ